MSVLFNFLEFTVIFLGAWAVFFFIMFASQTGKMLLAVLDAAFVWHTKEVVSFHCDLSLPTRFTPPKGPTASFILWPFRAGTRRSFFGKASALADMSANPLTCLRPTLNRPATGLRPAVGRLRGLFGHLGALTSCA